ncbi:unnamed protein product [Lampetra planeri]
MVDSFSITSAQPGRHRDTRSDLVALKEALSRTEVALAALGSSLQKEAATTRDTAGGPRVRTPLHAK